MKCPYCDYKFTSIIDFGIHMQEHPDKLNNEQSKALRIAGKLLGSLK